MQSIQGNIPSIVHCGAPGPGGFKPGADGSNMAVTALHWAPGFELISDQGSGISEG